MPPDFTSSESLFDFLLRHIPDQIYFKDLKGRFVCISRNVATRMEIGDPALLIGKTDFDFLAIETAREAMEDEQRIIRTGEPMIGKIEKEIHPDGRVEWAYSTKLPLKDAAGKIIGICGINKDFTAIKTMEDQLRETNEELTERTTALEKALLELRQSNERLKALQAQLIEAEKAQLSARLAFGVAHEIRNPLNILGMGIQYLASDPEMKKSAAPAGILDEMSDAVRRAESVISCLMKYSQPDQLNLTRCDLPDLVSECMGKLDREMKLAGIKQATEFQQELPPTRIDREKIGLVLTGLFQNAIQAMSSGGGTLTARIRVMQIGDETMRRDPGFRGPQRLRSEDRALLVEIEDTGHGIPDEVLPRVFDPFFTTRETGHGTGLGLTVSRKIIELHQGELALGNRPGGGACARIYLPMAAAL
jgi:PAS domain S-box-containing protein